MIPTDKRSGVVVPLPKTKASHHALHAYTNQLPLRSYDVSDLPTPDPSPFLFKMPDDQQISEKLTKHAQFEADLRCSGLEVFRVSVPFYLSFSRTGAYSVSMNVEFTRGEGEEHYLR